VSFVVFVLPFLAGEKINIGGAAENTLKKLNGERLFTPFSSTVEAKAMGLGPIAPSKYPCNFGTGNSFGSSVVILAIMQRYELNSAEYGRNFEN
jgi:hypothetical protein